MSRIYYPGIRLDAGTAQWRERLYFRFIDKVFQAMATKHHTDYYLNEAEGPCGCIYGVFRKALELGGKGNASKKVG